MVTKETWRVRTTVLHDTSSGFSRTLSSLLRPSTHKALVTTKTVPIVDRCTFVKRKNMDRGEDKARNTTAIQRQKKVLGIMEQK